MVIDAPKTCQDFLQHNSAAEYRIDKFEDRRVIASYLPDEVRKSWEAFFDVVNHSRVRRARNESVHAHASAQHVQSALDKLVQGNVWIRDADGSASIVRAGAAARLFDILGLGNANRAYRELTQAVRDDMEQLSRA